MSLNGELSIQLTLAKQGEHFHLNKIDINLARPNLAKKMLIGQTPENAIKRISQLMTVCQHAQSAAAKLALGYQLTDEEVLAIEHENIEQGFWRLIIDLPQLLEIELPLSVFINLRRVIAQQNSAGIIEFAEQLFQQLCQLCSNDFANLSSSALQLWLNENNSPMASCLREVNEIMPTVVGNSSKDNKPTLLADLPNDALLAMLGKLLQTDDCFYQKPHLNKQSCETGSLSIIQNHSLFSLLSTQGTVGRFISRLLYLAQKINELENNLLGSNVLKSNISGCFSLQQSEDITGKSTSLGWVQTARGLLIHLANIQQSKISQYSIVAPTEWNFHPQGSLNKILVNSNFSSPQVAEKSVKLAILALDPCIEFNLGVAYA